MVFFIVGKYAAHTTSPTKGVQWHLSCEVRMIYIIGGGING